MAREWTGILSDRAAGTVAGFIGANQDVNSYIPTPPSGSVNIASNSWLIETALSQAWRLNGGEVYDTTFGTLTSSNIIWPDGTPGSYAATLDSNGAVTSFIASYNSGVGKTVTATIPRNASSQVNGTVTVSVS